MTDRDWFEFTPERGAEGGGRDAWFCSEPLLSEPERTHREPQRCRCGGVELYGRERGCPNCGSPWRCDCGGRGRNGDDVCLGCGRKPEGKR